MKGQRNNFVPQMTPFPTNMMMFPNYMNDNCNNLENQINNLEKKINVLENRISRLENPYQNNMQNINQQQSYTPNYQTPQSNTNYNGEMYMM